jgi:hypothetical protein
VRPVGGCEIGRNNIGAAPGFADFRGNTFGFVRTTAVVNENLSTCGGQRQRAGAADAARSAGHQSGLS